MEKKKWPNIGIYTYHFQHLLISISPVTGLVSISAFASLVGIPITTTSSAIGLEICGVMARIKKYKAIIRKKKNNHHKILLFEKSKLNHIKLLRF